MIEILRKAFALIVLFPLAVVADTEESWGQIKSTLINTAADESVVDGILKDAFGRNISVSKALNIMKMIEAGTSGDWQKVKGDGAEFITGLASPTTGGYLAVHKAARQAIQATIRNWSEDLYATKAYNNLSDIVNQQVIASYKNGAPYMPSYLCGDDANLRNRMQAIEANMFKRWEKNHETAVIQLMHTHQAKLRQRMKKDPVRIEVFNHFLRKIVGDQRGYILTNFKRYYQRQAAVEVKKDIVLRAYEHLQTDVDVDALRQFARRIEQSLTRKSRILKQLEEIKDSGYSRKFIEEFLASDKSLAKRLTKFKRGYKEEVKPMIAKRNKLRKELAELYDRLSSLKKKAEPFLKRKKTLWDERNRLLREKEAINDQYKRNIKGSSDAAAVERYNQRLRRYKQEANRLKAAYKKTQSNLDPIAKARNPLLKKYNDKKKRRKDLSAKLDKILQQRKERRKAWDADRDKHVQRFNVNATNNEEYAAFWKKQKRNLALWKKLDEEFPKQNTLRGAKSEVNALSQLSRKLNPMMDRQQYTAAHKLVNESKYAEVYGYK